MNKVSESRSLERYSRELSTAELCASPIGNESVTTNNGETPVSVEDLAPYSRMLRDRLLGSPTAMWTYRNPVGRISLLVLRFDKDDGSKEFKVASFWKTGAGDIAHRWKLPPGKLPLYQLDAIAAGDRRPVVICEGEKAADAAGRIFPDAVATCWQGGTNALSRTDFSPLVGRTVVVWPDNDEPGLKAANNLLKILFGLGCDVKVIDAGQASSLQPNEPDRHRDPVPKWDAANAVTEWDDMSKLQAAMTALITPAKRPPNYHSYGRFVMSETGLSMTVAGRDREENDLQISGAFELCGETRAWDGTGWGRMLAWTDADGKRHTHIVESADLHADAGRVAATLASKGLRIFRGRAKSLADYINDADGLERIFTVRSTGWHNIEGARTFVVPSGSIGGQASSKVVLLEGASASFAANGSLAEWRDKVAAAVDGHSRLMFFVAAAFAAPLLGLLDYDGFGINLYGTSSTGKSTAAEASASVWGKGECGGFVRSWKNTDNGLESIAVLHNDVVLVLDELGTVGSESASQFSYQVASGTGKGRANRDGSAQQVRTWRTILVSTGELRVSDKISEDGRRPMAGQMVRLLDIPVDAGAGFGAFDHGGVTGNAKDLAEAIKAAARTSYGTAGPEFVRRLVSYDQAKLAVAASRAIETFRTEVVPANADGQIQRAAKSFAIVAFAGELAVELGVLPWPSGRAKWAAKACFQAWLEARKIVEPSTCNPIKLLQTFIEGAAERFVTIAGRGDITTDGSSDEELAGYWRPDRQEWLILGSVWKSIFDGYGVRRAALNLNERGVLRAHDGNQIHVRVNGTDTRFYAVGADRIEISWVRPQAAGD